MKRIVCWWRGHIIKADIVLMPPAGTYRYVFHCDRCQRVLSGPRP